MRNTLAVGARFLSKKSKTGTLGELLQEKLHSRPPAASIAKVAAPKSSGKHVRAQEKKASTKQNLSPSADLSGSARVAFLQAYAGVTPMPGRTAVKIDASIAVVDPVISAHAQNARNELSRWVSGGVRFHVHCEADGYVEAYRIGEEAALDRLLARNITPVGELDLHGATVAEAEGRVLSFIQTRARVGACALRLVHGKGNRSENGEQLRSEVHRVLEHGSVATYVRAFSTAPRHLGGSGATLVWVRMPA